MKYLGIDYGTKKVGLALSDENGTMGFPHGVVPNDANLKAYLLSLIEKEGVGAIVVGESKNYQGGDNPVAAHARAFAEKLGEVASVPIHFYSELLTSEEARRMPDGSRVSEGGVDASAAALILTHYFERP
ncbi:Holliday junction resolvase RuvX [Patescibacteria group bacterium]|nr:Holliday junction resolvase RuvX [Patescibacteria group bacterium]